MSAPGNEPGMDLPIRIVSDLHLAHSGCVIDDVEQLGPLIEGARSIVFNGDTCEQMTGRYRRQSKEMVEQLKDLCEVRGVVPVFLTGNHDPTLTERHFLDLADGSVLVTHGDTLFPMLSPWSRKIRESRPLIEAVIEEFGQKALESLDQRLEMTRQCARVMKQVDLEVGETLSARLKLLASELWPPRRPFAILGAWMRAPGLAVSLLEQYRPAARVVVFGHTHFPGLWRRRGKVAVNTGGYLGALNARFVEINHDGVFYSRVRRSGRGFEPSERRKRLL